MGTILEYDLPGLWLEIDSQESHSNACHPPAHPHTASDIMSEGILPWLGPEWSEPPIVNEQGRSAPLIVETLRAVATGTNEECLLGIRDIKRCLVAYLST